eukprot:CAMPEP_0181095496 /NCGR_PEP_ID=MMETSP1071-20121207/10546_1 /TAXON_ID=35127 /ORGANISM="Thalassiosira sp., Strain NH16" /LENGTH=224 /DNA_ID=CAMNT_0023177873 /DNA_START=64 /DNA_END=738 /DNA_ORIENTATION=+
MTVIMVVILMGSFLSPMMIPSVSAFADTPHFTSFRGPGRMASSADNSQQRTINPRSKTVALFAWLFQKSDEEEAAKDFTEKSEKEAEMMHRTAKMMEDHRRSQEAGERTAAIMEELASGLVVGKSKAGASGGLGLGDGRKGGVRVTFNGQQRPVGCEVDANFLFMESRGIVSIEELNEAITDAMQDGYDQSSKLMGEKIKGLYEQLGLSREPPPLPDEPDGKKK